MLIAAYRLAAIILTPAIFLWFLCRILIGKEIKERLQERFGFPTAHRPEGKLLWIHAASIGESISVQPFLQAFLQTYPDYHCLFTTGTKSSAILMQETLPAKCIHQFFPIDHPWVITLFLRYWHPQLVCWVESELWPTALTETAQQCPIFLLNGRMSKRSFRRWKRFPFFARRILAQFTSIFPQTKSDRLRFQHITPVGTSLHYLGNLKYTNPSTIIDDTIQKSWIDTISDRKVWIAASTHAGEETIITTIHKKLRALHPNLLTIIAPRHIDRAPTIMKTITDLSIARRSTGDIIQERTDIYLVDTFGELPSFYRYAEIALIGGSLIPIRGTAGHNPIEAGREECAILTGPHHSNFEDIYDHFIEHDAARIITSSEDTVELLDYLFSHKDDLSAIQKRAYQCTKTQENTPQKLLTHMKETINI